MQAAGKVCDRAFWPAALPHPLPTLPTPVRTSWASSSLASRPSSWSPERAAPLTSCVMSLGKSLNLRVPQFPLGATKGHNTLELGGGVRSCPLPLAESGSGHKSPSP